MTVSALPPRDALTIGFAHVAYRMQDAFAARRTGIRHFEVRTLDDLEARVAEADVLVVSGLWRNHLLERAPRLRFVQSLSAGADQYDKAAFRARGVRLASGQGVNERAVAEHAMGLVLALTRQLHLARDHQAARSWRPMIGDRAIREDELGGKTLAVVGFGRIGQRLARLARGFDMRVVGVRREARPMPELADAVLPTERLVEALAQADIVALTCPLTPETEGLINPAAFAAMKPGAILINVARGKVVDEAALLATLGDGRLSAAGLDCFHDEPLPKGSPFWELPNVLVTPHSAGETRRYEENVTDILLANLDRLWRGETELVNGLA
ncbi:D-2-hydroxyacid dehydrogenase [Alsobacter sp. SYSU M60028]|uniref:D-2-hydroxyacid dehydrogenase n=1 Tax=Alsobacter ponti TaxID=2962936 RepID=A0ABT1L9P2_9HYPH|nr:D-2-hydroxyacid dehydrogenase [Alsobacter ponti]MCP8936978.1 D-2-hydroxyacid dehydrogenase [Alsobacter ponti]